MTITKRRVAVLVLAALIAAALVATALLSSGTGTQTAAKAGGVVAVVADAKAKTAE
jgi:hypothetical protein